MKNIMKKLVLAALAPVMLSGCIEETFPEGGTVTADQVGQSATALQAMVNSIPTAMILYAQNYAQAWDFGYPAMAVSLAHMSGDVLIGGEDGYNWFGAWDQNIALSEEYVYGYQFWYNYYAWIKTCNDVISSVTATPEEQRTEEQNAYLGIALAFRAHFYLDLVRLFEPKPTTDPDIKHYEISDAIKGLSCVIVTEATTPEIAKANPRAKVEDVYNTVIFPDLELAEKCLKGYQRPNMTMPDISVVYGLLARAYLERGTAGVEGAYAQAAYYAREAIKCGYQPLTQAQWEDPINGFNNAESQNSWLWCTTQTSDQVQNLYSFIAHMSIEENWTNYGKTVGRSIPADLYESIADDDFRKHSWLDPQFFDYYEYKSCRPDAKEFFLTKYAGTTRTKEYGAIKFRPAQGDYTTYSVGNAIDFPTMRIEEMYLIEAEATAATDFAAGKTLLETFMKTYRQPSYACVAKDFAAFEQEIGKQARIEFWGEHASFFYKKRLAMGVHKDVKNCYINEARFDVDGIAPWWNLCIPITERQSNPAIAKEMNNPDPNETVDPIVK